MSLIAISVNPQKPDPEAVWKFTKGFLVRPTSLRLMESHILFMAWSPIIWTGGIRRQENFKCAYGIALDVDDGASVEDALSALGKYQHVLAPTKSHMKLKAGVIRPRFRMFLPSSRRIDNLAEYRATCAYYCQLLRADRCIDGARVFMPSTHILSCNDSGPRIVPEIPHPVKVFHNPIRTCGSILEVWAHNTMVDFKRFGGRNRAAFVASLRLKEAGRSPSWAVSFLQQRTDLNINEIEKVVKSAWQRQ